MPQREQNKIKKKVVRPNSHARERALRPSGRGVYLHVYSSARVEASVERQRFTIVSVGVN